MLIMNDTKIVARSFPDKGPIKGFRAEPNVPRIEIPLALFGRFKTEVTFTEFTAWATKRCFPPERVDAEDVLKALGLKTYDPWAIIQITEARLPMTDNFWIDFNH